MEQKLKEIIQFAEDNYPPKKFQHAMRVMCYTQEMCVEHGYCDDVELSALIVAVLHDIVEDTPIQEETLPNWCSVNEVYGERLSDTIMLLTHDKNKDTYDEYIDKIIRSNSILGKLVKAADMKDHLFQLDTLTPDRLNKYKPHIYKFIF